MPKLREVYPSRGKIRFNPETEKVEYYSNLAKAWLPSALNNHSFVEAIKMHSKDDISAAIAVIRYPYEND